MACTPCSRNTWAFHSSIPNNPFCQPIRPPLGHWASPFVWEGQPNFAKQGFHLHTMHPTELTEALHDPGMENGWDYLRHYMDWLARNGQNYFDFSLMEGVEDDYPAWLRHAQRIVEYAHGRGILVGVDVSVHMLQQKSFQLVHFPPKSWVDPEKQVRARLRELIGAGFDVINLEFALAEFVGGLENLRDRLRAVAIDEITKYPHVKLVGRQHVIKPESELGGSHDASALNVPKDPSMGLLVHTVMCYALEDASAPVYQLKDFSHLLKLLGESIPERETWYYPESAYWITFDNSVPMLLLPYLGARWRDMQTVAEMGAHGHLTFSSGWEWGYWVVDWSIARWGWKHTVNGKVVPSYPTQFLEKMTCSPAAVGHVRALHDIMERELVQKNLLAHLCPSSPTDEFPAPLNQQFQPRAAWSMHDLRKRKFTDTLQLLLPIIAQLKSTADSLDFHLAALKRDSPPYPWLQNEILAAVKVTVLRMRHRVCLYEALVNRGKRGKNWKSIWEKDLEAAAMVRQEALVHVAKMEQDIYRYPVDLLTSRYRSFTAYDYGYLHSVHQLHFWEREEMQLKSGRPGPFYHSVFDLAKIGGVKN
jgi:hypothetical protein